MMLPDDDELYEVDQTYLGPPRRYIGNFRYKAIGAFLAIGPLTFVVLRQIGMPNHLLTWGLATMFVLGVSGAIADLATAERPISSLFATFNNDLRARRDQVGTQRASASNFTRRVRPSGQLAKWVARNSRSSASAEEKSTAPVGAALSTD